MIFNRSIINLGTMHEGNVVVLSPSSGPFASRFVQCGAAVRTGDLLDLLRDIRDVFCILCNTIMTANIVLELSRRPQPVIWILHEWWDDAMIIENLRIRNIEGMTIDTVKEAMSKSSKVVCVCEGQRKLYNPAASSTVIYVGVPRPVHSSIFQSTTDKEFIFLVLGIVCPRKNQVWAVQLFKKFAKDKSNVRLLIVGARYTRPYEIEYVEKVKHEIGEDSRIELHNVTEEVDKYYEIANVLLFTSINEVTPMVISEAMSYSLPVISTNIAGIPEMIRHGSEGYLVDPFDDDSAIYYMNELFQDTSLRRAIGARGRTRFEECFDLNIMVDQYRRLIYEVAPPTVLVDMDGVIVDWDTGFRAAWNSRSAIDRSKSYYMENCVEEYHREAELLYHTKGFFENLPPVDGAVRALQDMQDEGLRVLICSTPVLTSLYCAQEKINWVRQYLGESWLDKLILCADKVSDKREGRWVAHTHRPTLTHFRPLYLILINTCHSELYSPPTTSVSPVWARLSVLFPFPLPLSLPVLLQAQVRGDILIDDKPLDVLAPMGKHTAATWKQIIFDAHYNQSSTLPRLTHWRDWKKVIRPLLGATARYHYLSTTLCHISIFGS